MVRWLIALTLLAPIRSVRADPTQIIEADLGSGVIGAGYEHRLADKISARVTLQLERPWYTGIVGGTKTDAIGFGVELRPWIFPLRAGPAGFYVSPFARLCTIKATDGAPMEKSGIAWSAGLTAGYGWLLSHERILLRLGAGVQYWGFELEPHVGVDGLYPDVDIIVGYAF